MTTPRFAVRVALASLALCFILAPCLLLAPIASAQEVPSSAALPEHKWLQKFVGEWETEASGTTEDAKPGEPAIICKGAMKVRMLGDLWMVSDSQTEMMGVTVSAVQTIGYDGKSKKYVGTWVDSMYNHLWKYEGWVDAGGSVLTLEAEGPSFYEEGKTSKFRDVFEFKSADRFVIRSQVQKADGSWQTFMSGEARRKQ